MVETEPFNPLKFLGHGPQQLEVHLFSPCNVKSASGVQTHRPQDCTFHKRHGMSCTFATPACQWTRRVFQPHLRSQRLSSASVHVPPCQVRKVVRALGEAGGDERVAGLVAYVGDAAAGAGLAVVQELRAAVQDFRWGGDKHARKDASLRRALSPRGTAGSNQLGQCSRGQRPDLATLQGLHHSAACHARILLLLSHLCYSCLMLDASFAMHDGVTDPCALDPSGTGSSRRDVRRQSHMRTRLARPARWAPLPTSWHPPLTRCDSRHMPRKQRS